MYHKYNSLVRTGDYYRISSYRENGYNDCWMVVSQEKSRALITYIKVLSRPNSRSVLIKPQGLDPDKAYRITCDKRVLGIEYPSIRPWSFEDADAGPADESFHEEESPKEEALRLSQEFILHGDTIMNAGLLINEGSPDMAGDFRGVLIELESIG